MKIQICEKQLSAHATPLEAQQLVAELAAIRWPCEYVDENTQAIWYFPNWQTLNAFERDFEAIVEDLWPNSYSWRVVPENRFPDLGPRKLAANEKFT